MRYEKHSRLPRQLHALPAPTRHAVTAGYHGAAAAFTPLASCRISARPVILDIFGGQGGMAKAVRRRGYATITVDLIWGDEFDLLQGDVIALLIGWINGGQVIGLFCATPCEGYSRARRAPPWPRLPRALRSPQHVRALPNLSPVDQAALDRSNALGKAAALLLRTAFDRSPPLR